MQVITHTNLQTRLIEIEVDAGQLTGELVIPVDASGIILFSHSCGSTRFNSHHYQLAHFLQRAGFASLMINLLTEQEENIDARAHHFCFDVSLLANRLVLISAWLAQYPPTSHLQVGYLGDDVGSAGAVMAAIRCPELVGAIVSQSGRLDFINSDCSQLTTPTLLIVGETDFPTVGMNTEALHQISAPCEFAKIAHASHQLEEAGTIAEVARLSVHWFKQHLTAATPCT